MYILRNIFSEIILAFLNNLKNFWFLNNFVLSENYHPSGIHAYSDFF